MSAAIAKKGFKLAPAMALDMRGRLVADERVVFNSAFVKSEIDAALAMSKRLAKARAKKRAKRNVDPTA